MIQKTIKQFYKSLITTSKYCYSTKNTYAGKPALITVAITGDVPLKNRLASVPITPEEQIKDIIECYEAGARMTHVHVRNDDGSPTWKKERYNQVLNGVRKHCPEMIVQFSTGNYGPTIEERSECIDLEPDLVSFTPGSVNFLKTRKSANMYINTHEDIEYIAKKMLEKELRPDVAIFDVSMLYNTHLLMKRGLLKYKPIRFMFVFGGHMALPARESLLDFLISECEDLFGKDGFTWCSIGVGWNHDSILRSCLERGGHPRTGIEDTLMIKKRVYAHSNKQLVEHVAKLCKEYERPIATPKQAREILGL